jgi:YHS domain-containing protein
MTGEPIPDGAKAFDWNGLRFRTCCAGCGEGFKKDPGAALAKAREKGWTVATTVFDPVSGRKLTPQNAKGGYSDYGAVRFAFQTGAGKASFDADPKRYGTIPLKSSTLCPVMSLELSNTYLAPGYADFEGVRYFACCDTCFPKLRANPGAFVAAAEGTIGPPKVYEVPAVWQKMTGPGGLAQ